MPLKGMCSSNAQALLPEFRRVTEAYFSAVKGVGRHLQRLISLALHLPPDYFDPYFTKPMVYLRPLHYAPRKSDPGKVHLLQVQSLRSVGSRALCRGCASDGRCPATR